MSCHGRRVRGPSLEWRSPSMGAKRLESCLARAECGYHRDIILVYLMGYFFGRYRILYIVSNWICVKRYNGHTVLLPGMWKLWCWFDGSPVLDQPRLNEMGAFQTLLSFFFVALQMDPVVLFPWYSLRSGAVPLYPRCDFMASLHSRLQNNIPHFSRSKPNITPRVCAPEIGWRELYKTPHNFIGSFFALKPTLIICIYIWYMCYLMVIQHSLFMFLLGKHR